MKSSRISVVTMLLWAVVSFVGKAQNQAPEKIEYGVTAGANFSNLILNDEFKQLETKGMQLGGEMGAFMRINLCPHFALQPELNFYYYATGLKASVMPPLGGEEAVPHVVENKINQWGMQIPIYAMAMIPTDYGRFYIGAGPFVGIGFAAQTNEVEFATKWLNIPFKLEPIQLYERHNEKSALHRWNVGIACRMGYEFNNGILLNLGYNYGFLDQAGDLRTSLSDHFIRTGIELRDVNYVAHQHAVSLGIGYRF